MSSVKSARSSTMKVPGSCVGGRALARVQGRSQGTRGSRGVAMKGTDRDIQIIPSVLPADWANMGQCVADLEAAGVDRIQFDVMDGNFVPNPTFGPEMISACRKYCKTPFETQLMVSQYASEVMLEEYVEATKGPNGEPGRHCGGRLRRRHRGRWRDQGRLDHPQCRDA